MEIDCQREKLLDDDYLGKFKTITFDMRGVLKSTGRASTTGFAEVDVVVSVCNRVSLNLSARCILLVGSSAGVKEFEARWIRWSGVNVPDEIGQKSLTRALAEKIISL